MTHKRHGWAGGRVPRAASWIFLALVAALLAGCNKQAKINSQKIDQLNQRIAQLEKEQQQQTRILQGEMNALAPELDRINSSYFEKDQDAALFFHTNTLYLLLTIGRQIEGQLQLADTERQTANGLDYTYHTNQLGALYICTTQLVQAVEDTRKAVVEEVNQSTRQAVGEAEADTVAAVKAASAPDPALAAWRQQMIASLAQINQRLDVLASKMPATNGAIFLK